MKSIIVGTAGHIDHGKTALVRALTGIDADRLEEEKRRGITIDLGFAHLELPLPGGDVLRIGFVDVPGHERFVRNMLAGVGGIDLVLLVIAADESIKPQTREHFDILQLIGVKRGITVLTKSDAVDAETLEVVRLEVEEFLRGTFLDSSAAPIIPVSSLTGAGIEDLKRALIAAADSVATRDAQAFTRLPIDRVFTMKGFGTVVTGTLVAGTIRREEEMELFPSRRRVRVRGVQVHGAATESALAGQRTALNLSGVSTAEVARGMMLASAGKLDATRRCDVQLRVLPSAPRGLKERSRVHFHCYTMERVASVRLLGQAQVAPGAEAFARITLPGDAMLLPGDRFIIRQFSPVVTIGGGIVLDAAPIRRFAGLSGYLEILAGGNSMEVLQARIARRGGSGIQVAALVAEMGKTLSEIEAMAGQAVKAGGIVRFGDLLMHEAAVKAVKAGLVSAIAQFHKKNPLVPGISREQLREQSKAPAEAFAAVLGVLVGEKKLEVSGDLIHLAGHGVVLRDEEAESKKKIEDAFLAAGLRVPALPEVLAGLKVDKARAQKIVTLLMREKILIKISDDLVFHQSALAELRRQIVAYKAKVSKIDVGAFKELTGVSRKYAIPLLEYLDRERVTRRVGDAREIL